MNDEGLIVLNVLGSDRTHKKFERLIQDKTIVFFLIFTNYYIFLKKVYNSS